MANPFRFLREVRQEVSKVVWPTRREVLTTSLLVFIFAGLAAIFFWIGDIFMDFGVQTLHSFFGGS